MGGTDGIAQLDRGDVLLKVADRPGLQGTLDHVLLGKAGQGNDLDLRIFLMDGAGGGDPVHAGHHQVHDDHVRMQAARLLDGFGAV